MDGGGAKSLVSSGHGTLHSYGSSCYHSGKTCLLLWSKLFPVFMFVA